MRLFGMKIRGFEVVDDGYRKFPHIDIQLPQQGTEDSMGYDFFSNETVTIMPGQQHLFVTDVKAYMRKRECLVGNVRSNQGLKQNLSFANSQAWIDSDYYNSPKTNGNIGVCLYNYGDKPQVVEVGDRIAQFSFKPWLKSDNGNSKAKRKGGFGSTGVKEVA
jgi:dUTP pyrophosphatase